MECHYIWIAVEIVINFYGTFCNPSSTLCLFSTQTYCFRHFSHLPYWDLMQICIRSGLNNLKANVEFLTTTSKYGIQSWCLFNKLFDMFSDNKQWNVLANKIHCICSCTNIEVPFIAERKCSRRNEFNYSFVEFHLKIAIWLESQKFPIPVNGYVKSPFSGSQSSKRKYLPLTKYSDGIEMLVMNSSPTQQKLCSLQERQFIICVPWVERTTREFHFYRLCIRLLKLVCLRFVPKWHQVHAQLWKQRKNTFGGACAWLYGLVEVDKFKLCIIHAVDYHVSKLYVLFFVSWITILRSKQANSV